MPSFKIIDLVLEKIVLKVFAISSHGGHLGHLYKLSFHLQKNASYEVLLFDWPSSFTGEDV